MKNLKKVVLYIFLFLLCLSIKWYRAGRELRDRNTFYWGETVQTDGSEDTLFFRGADVGCKVYQFSVPDQEIIKGYSAVYSEQSPGVGSAQRYIVTDRYIFYEANAGTIWRRRRETSGSENGDEFRDIEEFHVDVSSTRLAAYGGFLFYGDNCDIYACAIDGNPETDGISLAGQFPEEDAEPRIGERQEIVYNGWRVSRMYGFDRGHEYTLWDIIDEDSKDVILAPETHYEYELEWCCYTTRADKEWVTLYIYPNENPSWQRAGEEEKHEIECMSDPIYRYSAPKGFTYEDGKVIAKITVCKGDDNWLFHLLRGIRSDDEDHDILLEIDLETDTCRIRYSTGNSHAKILGYRSGMVYCFYDGIIYQEVLEDGKREHILNLSKGEWKEYWKGSDRPLVTYWCGDYLLVNIGEKAECIYLPD